MDDEESYDEDIYKRWQQRLGGNKDVKQDNKYTGGHNLVNEYKD